MTQEGKKRRIEWRGATQTLHSHIYTLAKYWAALDFCGMGLNYRGGPYNVPTTKNLFTVTYMLRIPAYINRRGRLARPSNQ
jgi:hypothetical protein